MARPPSARPPRVEPPVRPAPAVRDFRWGASYEIEWDVRTVYDFVISLSDDAGASDDLPSADRRWLNEARESLPDAIRADRKALLGTELCIQIDELAVDHPAITEPGAFTEVVASLDPMTAGRYLLADLYHEPATAALIDRAMDGDSAALNELATTLPEEKGKARLEIVKDPAGTLRRLTGVLRAWEKPFAIVEPRVASMIRRDFEARAADIRTLSPGDLIEKTTGGLRYVPERTVRRVVLAPSYFARPFNFLFSKDDWRLYCYPIADSALDTGDPLEPPPAVVRLHRALGDPSRLRILRLLADGDRYLTEIAQVLELSKPTVKHHMAQLRAAGLVTLTEEGSLTYYSLRRDRLADVGSDLRQFIAN
jgi:DNA-binding transcriptional ArsR family regulator